jgi:hypothetical protein
VTAAEVDSAVARITGRRAHIDDPHRDELGVDPREALDYLLRRTAGVPRWVQQAEVNDALVLITWLWWQDKRRELRVLTRGRSLNLPLSQLGAPLGIGGQGVTDRIDRLSALLEFDRPDEKLTRATRQAIRSAGPERAWIDDQRTTIRAVLTALLEQATRAGFYPPTPDQPTPGHDENSENGEPSAGEWLDELRHELGTDTFSPATLALLGQACAALQADPTVLGLDTRHGLHRALRTAARLRTAFARLKSTTTDRP